jgi:hypothetical protein
MSRPLHILSLFIYIYIYIYICVCVCVCLYVCARAYNMSGRFNIPRFSQIFRYKFKQIPNFYEISLRSLKILYHYKTNKWQKYLTSSIVKRNNKTKKHV